MTARPPAETVTPAMLEQVCIVLDWVAKKKKLTPYMLEVLVHQWAESKDEHTDPTATIRDDVLAALERGESVSVVCGRWHLSRWAVERIRAGEGQG